MRPWLLTLILSSAAPALHAQLSCIVQAAGTPSIRASGFTEQMGDLIIICTGGQPAAAGAALPQRTITVAKLGPGEITSRDLATSNGTTWTDALLLVDEPGAFGPGPINLCAAPGGICPGTGTGSGPGVYSQNTPNVYQGARVSPNSIRFTLPWADPGNGNSRVIRITNVRVNAQPTAVDRGTTAPITLSVNMEAVALANPDVTVGVIQQDLLQSGQVLTFQPAGATAREPVGTIVFTEQFPTVLRRRSIALPSPDPRTSPTPPAPSNQDVPGTIYQTETGFYRQQFPNISGRGDLAKAGLADSGTRLFLRVPAPPPGVSLWARAAAPVSSLQGSPGTIRTGTATAIQTSGFGTEPFSAAPADSEGFFPLPAQNGALVGVWEIVNADTTTIERVSIEIRATYPPNLNWAARPEISLAPGRLDSGSPIPSFSMAGGTSSNCNYTSRTDPSPIPYWGGKVQLIVDTTQGCGWSVTTRDLPPWAVAISGPHYQGSGTATLEVVANNGPPRAFNIGGLNLPFAQSGAGRPSFGPPVITSPAASQAIDTTAVTLSWQPVPNATGYSVAVTRGWSDFVVPLEITSSVSAPATSTVLSLRSSPAMYRARVRACIGGYSDSQCGPFAIRDFRVVEGAKPQGSVNITAPVQGQALTSSTNQFSWDPVPGATWYKVRLSPAATNDLVRVDAPSTSTILTLKSGNYVLRVAPCATACAIESVQTFSVVLPPVPTAAPVVSSHQITNGNLLDVTWTAVPTADLYQIQIVQPNTGPGGGALTVAARQLSTTSTQLAVPSGPASILVSACNGNGCGPFSLPVPIQPPGPNPAAPVIGTPMAGVTTTGPSVLFTWNRVPGDNGTNTIYRLYVADLARSGTAADVYTTSNFAAVQLTSDGRRYDAVVVANPGTPNERQGPPSGFQVTGQNPLSPTLVSPGHNSSVRSGMVRLGWSPFETYAPFTYFVTSTNGAVSYGGLAVGTFVELPLPAINGQPTPYSAVTRACTLPNDFSCLLNSDTSWGPWSNAAGGSGVTNFTVLP